MRTILLSALYVIYNEFHKALNNHQVCTQLIIDNLFTIYRSFAAIYYIAAAY